MIAKTHWILVFAFSLAALPAGANPRDLERALSLYDSGELAGSLAVFERALSGGENDGEAMRSIYVHLGILRAGAGDTEGAIQAFRALLSLDPTAQPPPDASPVILDPFAAAKSARGDAPALGVVVGDEETTHEVGERHVVTMRVIGDSEALVGSVRIEILRGGAAGASVASTAESGDLAYRIVLFDAHGSTLVAVGPRTVSVFAQRETTSRRGILSSPFVWGGAAAVVAGTILVVVLASGGSGKATVGAPEWSAR